MLGLEQKNQKDKTILWSNQINVKQPLSPTEQPEEKANIPSAQEKEKLQADVQKFIQFCETHVDLIKDMQRFEYESNERAEIQKNLIAANKLLSVKKMELSEAISSDEDGCREVLWDILSIDICSSKEFDLNSRSLSAYLEEKVFAPKRFDILLNCAVLRDDIKDKVTVISGLVDEIENIRKNLYEKGKCANFFNEAEPEFKRLMSQEKIEYSDDLGIGIDALFEKEESDINERIGSLTKAAQDFIENLSERISFIACKKEFNAELNKGVAKLAGMQCLRNSDLTLLVCDIKRGIEIGHVKYINEVLFGENFVKFLEEDAKTQRDLRLKHAELKKSLVNSDSDENEESTESGCVVLNGNPNSYEQIVESDNVRGWGCKIM